MRAFLAAEPPDPIRAQAAALAEALQTRLGLRGMRWVDPARLHLTFLFLGSIDAPEPLLPSLARLARELDPFPLRPTGLGAFPNLRSPRVLFLDLEGAWEPVQTWRECLVEACRPFAPELDDKPLRPHLTLARIKAEPAPDLRAVARQLLPEPDSGRPTWWVDRMSLIESVLTPEGPLYRAIEQWQLGEG